MASLTTSVEPLEGNLVRISVTVPSDEFENAINAAFRKLASEVRIPGFRPGKAPRALLEARFGPDVARDQALRDALPDYYAQAVIAESVDVIAPPEIDITAGEESGDVAFDAVVEVRPIVTIEGYDGLRVEVPSPDVPDESIDAQVDGLRDRFADLEESTTPLIDGNFASIDIKGSIDDDVIDALSATDFLYEVGSGMLVDELDAELRGTEPGAILQFDAVLSDRFGDRAGDTVAFQVLVKEAKRKVLPEPTDEWVSEVSEFDTLEDLRNDVRTRLGLVAKVQGQMLVRDKVLEGAAQLVDIEIPEALVNDEMERRLHDLAHRLDAQGATIPQYLMATGQEQGPFVDQLRETATDAVRADLALRAVVAQEAIEASDEEIDREIERLAERMEAKPARVRKDLEQRGAIEALRSDLARGKALRFLVDHANVVDEEGNSVDLSLPDDETEGAEAPQVPESSHQQVPESSESAEESPE